jgi:hypothetical protein
MPDKPEDTLRNFVERHLEKPAERHPGHSLPKENKLLEIVETQCLYGQS